MRFRKFTKETTPVLLSVLLGLRVLGTILSYALPNVFLEWILFDPKAILQGEVWRLVSFVMYPYGGGLSSVLFLALVTYFTFEIGRALKQIIGEAKLNFYLISGLILEVILGFVYYFVMTSSPNLLVNAGYIRSLNPGNIYYMLFVLFAMLFPEEQFLLMFIIPVKGKWLIFITLGLLLLDVVDAFVQAARIGFGFGYAWVLIAMIVAAILAVLLTVVYLRNGGKLFKPKTGASGKTAERGGRVFRNAWTKAEGRKTGDPVRMRRPGEDAKHKCTVCGRTEKTNPELEFRYCTKCVGNYEYCSDHLYTHVHKSSESQ